MSVTWRDLQDLFCKVSVPLQSRHSEIQASLPPHFILQVPMLCAELNQQWLLYSSLCHPATVPTAGLHKPASLPSYWQKQRKRARGSQIAWGKYKTAWSSRAKLCVQLAVTLQQKAAQPHHSHWFTSHHIPHSYSQRQTSTWKHRYTHALAFSHSCCLNRAVAQVHLCFPKEQPWPCQTGERSCADMHPHSSTVRKKIFSSDSFFHLTHRAEISPEKSKIKSSPGRSILKAETSSLRKRLECSKFPP